MAESSSGSPSGNAPGRISTPSSRRLSFISRLRSPKESAKADRRTSLSVIPPPTSSLRGADPPVPLSPVSRTASQGSQARMSLPSSPAQVASKKLTPLDARAVAMAIMKNDATSSNASMMGSHPSFFRRRSENFTSNGTFNVTIPEAIHSPSHRSPKLARVVFSRPSLLTSNPGVAGAIAAAAGTSSMGVLDGAAVRESMERIVMAHPLPPIAPAALSPTDDLAERLDSSSGFMPAVPSSLSIQLPFPSLPTPLSYLIGQSKPHRETIIVSLQQLQKIPPPPRHLGKVRRQSDSLSLIAVEWLTITLQYAGKTSISLLGIVNIGNTCFLASALQCLLSIDILTNYMLHNVRPDINPFSESGGAMAVAYSAIVKEMASSRVPVSPRAFKREVERWAPQFVGYDQQDAQEFLRFLLDGLSSDLNRVRYDAKFAVTEAEEDALPLEVKAAVFWSKSLHRTASLVSDLFAGQLMSSIRCWSCEHVSVTFDIFWDLSLPIPITNTYSQSEWPSHSAKFERGANRAPHNSVISASIEDCLREFAREEELDQNEWYHCAKCKQRRRTSKRLQVYRLPRILVIHLKRFTSYRRKISVEVDFPFEDLDVSIAATDVTPIRYRLIGVVQHYGSLYSGHYVATVQRNSEWYRMNDSSVTHMQPPQRSDWKADAYVLFYQAMDLDQ